MKPVLSFGHNDVVPENVTTAYGARLIFPDDLLPDRQSFPGIETPDGQKLQAWLNGGKALRKALAAAAKMADRGELAQNEDRDVTLYEDATGAIVGNARNSFGYLYIAAWLKG